MEYFWIRQDVRRPSTCMIENLSNIPNYAEVQNGNWEVLESLSVINVLPGQIHNCPDILDRQVFMVRNAFREVLELFLPSLEYRDICLLDPKSEEHIYYEVPLLPKADCYSKQSEANLNHTVIKHLALCKDAIPNEHIFRVAGIPSTIVVMNLIAAEALLRRRPIGIQVLPIKLV